MTTKRLFSISGLVLTLALAPVALAQTPLGSEWTVIQGGACPCADVNGMNGVTIPDVTVFVTDLLAGTACP